ncbi:TIGR02391 family protein [Streptomyces sp. NPDC005899]|uniref:TIGR02391 family protein n=1 Tax=Streptomyces sp. NPDC005899 TaxID=3155716 RepID=UPI0033E597B5
MTSARISGPLVPELIRTLPTPELGLHLLASLAENANINSNNVLRGFQSSFGGGYGGNPAEPDLDRLLQRIADAWAWLVSKGLIGPNPTQDQNWSRVTTEGRALAQDPAALLELHGAERLAGPLDQALTKARTYFNLGDYETACFAAMKAVEVAVRDASGLANGFTGTALMQQAFQPEKGPLTDTESERGEQVGMMSFFAGAFGAFRNPVGHRTVHFDDPMEAAEIIQTADLMLRIVRRAQKRNGAADA